jgi:hypothetical protein
MNSETLTEQPAREGAGLTPWQFFLLLAMLGATAAVITARDTHPAALLLLSAAVISAGFVAVALHRALGALLGRQGPSMSRPAGRTRQLLEEDKALVLRSIKELEFDRSMGKVSEADFQEIGGRLRSRALALMQQIEGLDDRHEAGPTASTEAGPLGPAPGRAPDLKVRPPSEVTGPRRRSRACTSCATASDADAKFCKQCGARLGEERA